MCRHPTGRRDPQHATAGGAPSSGIPHGAGSGPVVALCAREGAGELRVDQANLDALRRRVQQALG